jgi:3-dehydroquinate dehydratase type I
MRFSFWLPSMRRYRLLTPSNSGSTTSLTSTSKPYSRSSRGRKDLDNHRLIFTLRPREQGGQRDLSLDERKAFWRSIPAELIGGSDFADLEIDVVEKYVLEGSPIPWQRVICSYHDFEGTPTDLNRIFDRLSRTPAHIIKVATLARHPNDCVRHFELIDRGGTPGSVIALAMGMPGIATRVLAVSRGAMLTFGALRRERKAPVVNLPLQSSTTSTTSNH